MRIAIVASMQPHKISGFANSVLRLASATAPYAETVVATSASNQVAFNADGVWVIASSDLDVRDFDCVVLTGCFDPQLWRMSNICRRYNVPYIVSPRSNLTRNSWAKSWLKKWIASPFIFGIYLRHSAAVHFLAAEEAAHSWNPGAGSSFVCPDVHSADTCAGQVSVRRRMIGFLGRLDVHHKGLDVLLTAIAKISDRLRELGFCVELVGPDHRGSVKWIKTTSKRLKIDDLVNVLEPMNGSEKIEWLQKVGIFVHSSRYEGQPLAVFEAVGAGSYPVVSSNCNMSEFIQRLGYGQVSGSSAESVSKAILTGAGRQSTVDLERAKSILQRYTPDAVGREFCEHLLKIVREQPRRHQEGRTI